MQGRAQVDRLALVAGDLLASEQDGDLGRQGQHLAGDGEAERALVVVVAGEADLARERPDGRRVELDGEAVRFAAGQDGREALDQRVARRQVDLPERQVQLAVVADRQRHLRCGAPVQGAAEVDRHGLAVGELDAPEQHGDLLGGLLDAGQRAGEGAAVEGGHDEVVAAGPVGREPRERDRSVRAGQADPVVVAAGAGYADPRAGDGRAVLRHRDGQVRCLADGHLGVVGNRQVRRRAGAEHHLRVAEVVEQARRQDRRRGRPAVGVEEADLGAVERLGRAERRGVLGTAPRRVDVVPERVKQPHRQAVVVAGVAHPGRRDHTDGAPVGLALPGLGEAVLPVESAGQAVDAEDDRLTVAVGKCADVLGLERRVLPTRDATVVAVQHDADTGVDRRRDGVPGGSGVGPEGGPLRRYGIGRVEPPVEGPAAVAVRGQMQARRRQGRVHRVALVERIVGEVARVAAKGVVDPVQVLHEHPLADAVRRPTVLEVTGDQRVVVPVARVGLAVVREHLVDDRGDVGLRAARQPADRQVRPGVAFHAGVWVIGGPPMPGAVVGMADDLVAGHVLVIAHEQDVRRVHARMVGVGDVVEDVQVSVVAVAGGDLRQPLDVGPVALTLLPGGQGQDPLVVLVGGDDEVVRLGRAGRQVDPVQQQPWLERLQQHQGAAAGAAGAEDPSISRHVASTGHRILLAARPRGHAVSVRS